MKTSDIITAYLLFEQLSKGKHRPLVVLSIDDHILNTFKVTTKYHEKSYSIRRKYYPIQQWQEAGLHQPSYIDTFQYRQLNLLTLSSKIKQVGRLTINDYITLQKFIKST